MRRRILSTMAKYEVELKEISKYTMFVEADSPTEARHKAWKHLDAEGTKKDDYFYDCDDDSEAYETNEDVEVDVK